MEWCTANSVDPPPAGPGRTKTLLGGRGTFGRSHGAFLGRPGFFAASTAAAGLFVETLLRGCFFLGATFTLAELLARPALTPCLVRSCSGTADATRADEEEEEETAAAREAVLMTRARTRAVLPWYPLLMGPAAPEE